MKNTNMNTQAQAAFALKYMGTKYGQERIDNLLGFCDYNYTVTDVDGKFSIITVVIDGMYSRKCAIDEAQELLENITEAITDQGEVRVLTQNW